MIQSITAAKSAAPPDAKTAFQDAVAGMFYGQMIKALRSGVGKPAYFHGGQAEEMFQSQMDQKVAENLARSHGNRFVDDLYQRFLVDHPQLQAKKEDPLAPLLQAANSTGAVEPARLASWSPSATSVSRNTTGTEVIPALNRK